MNTLFPTSVSVPEERVLPDLQGSERQCKWAADIRAGKLKRLHEHLRQWAALIQRYEDASREDLAEKERDGYRAAVDLLLITLLPSGPAALG